MECDDTPHSIVSIWIQTYIQSIDLHGLWRHFTFHNIHMDMDVVSCSNIITVTHFRYQNDLFKIGTILFIIIQGF